MAAGGAEPTIWPEVRYRDAAAAIEWFERTVGFVCAMKIPGQDGAPMHAELRLGRAVFMLGLEMPDSEWADATQVVSLRVDDPDAHFARDSGRRRHRARTADRTVRRGLLCRPRSGGLPLVGTDTPLPAERHRPGNIW